MLSNTEIVDLLILEVQKSSDVSTSNIISDIRQAIIARLETAQQGAQRTTDKPCEKHGIEYCGECYAATVVK